MTRDQRQKMAEIDRLSTEVLALERAGEKDEAVKRTRRVLELRKPVLGELHRDFASSLNKLAELLESRRDYAGARPLYEQVMAIRKEALSERHPEFAQSLNNLASLLESQGDYARAAPLLEQSLANSERNLALAFAGQSERQQLAMTVNLRWLVDSYLSLAPLAELVARTSYPHVMATKGAVFNRQRLLRTRRRMLRADPESEAARGFAEYEKTVAGLATLALAVPDPKEAATWRDAVAKLSRRKDELEAELAQFDAGFRVARAEARRTPEQLQAAIPHGTALVDYLAYTKFRPPAQGKGWFQRERSLVAFVVRPDRRIERIDLGPMAPIQKAIDEWRPILTQRKVKLATGDPALELRRLIWEPLLSTDRP
jgi:tetratricopeptide (TPR) repeat protein